MQSRRYNITQEFIAACQLLAVDPHRVLACMGLPSKLLKQDELSLSAREVGLAFTQIISEYGRDDFHIRLADGFAKGAFGHAFLALQCSENLRKGIHRVAHFKLLIEPVDWVIRESAETLRIELRALSGDFPLVGIGQIMSFLWLVKSCRNLTARTVVPSQVTITDAVPHQAQIEAELGCPITLGDQAILEFPASTMDLPILSSNRGVISNLGSADDLGVNDGDDGEDAFIALVQSIVLELLPSGVVTLERTAAKLTMSQRTLARRLQERNTSFKEVVRICRSQSAQYYLHETRYPIEEISLLLGYRETNSFYRAFREWFNSSPNQERKNHQNQGKQAKYSA